MEEPEAEEVDAEVQPGEDADDSSDDSDVSPPSDVVEEIPEAAYVWGSASIPKC